jgi:hypothetical protein
LAVWIARRCASLHSRRDTARPCRRQPRSFALWRRLRAQ